MSLAIFGIDNDGINLALNLLILFLVVIYLALVAWVYLDAKRRLEDPVLVACATVAALFPFVGPIVYSILRPPELLADARERALEIRASELRVRQLEESSCPNCEHPVERTYLRCPQCRARIKDPCESCGKPVDPRWTLCPYCETPNRRAQAASAAPPAKQRRGLPGRKPASATRSSASGARPSESGSRPAESGSRSTQRSSSESRQQSRPQRSPASVRSSETRPLKTLPDSDSGSDSRASAKPAEPPSTSSAARKKPRASNSGSGSSPAPAPAPSRRSSSASRERPERS